MSWRTKATPPLPPCGAFHEEWKNVWPERACDSGESPIDRPTIAGPPAVLYDRLLQATRHRVDSPGVDRDLKKAIALGEVLGEPGHDRVPRSGVAHAK